MGKKNLFLRIILLLMVVGVGFIAFRSAGAASEPEIGPYTEIQLPLEDLPALPEDQVYNPVVELTSGEPSRPTVSLPDDHSLDDRATAVAHFPQESLTGPYLQVLYVLEDPREVPLARYAYNNSDGVVKPVADMEQLAGHSLKTINVYVKVQNLNSQPLTDPLIASEHTDTSWPALYVSLLSLELEGISQFPCAAVEYANGTEPYVLPAGIDGGDAVGEGGLYNPAAYAPPRPWYYGEESTLQPGEAREGWVSCLAPDVPLEQLQVKAQHRYMREPEVVTFNPYSPESGAFPDYERLASVGLTLADFPATIEDCEVMDHCVNSCAKAKESGVEQGLCGYQSILHISTGEREHIFHGFRTIEYTEPVQRSYLAWAYTPPSSFPVSLNTLDDVPLTFYGDQFMEDIATVGAVTFYNPRIAYSGVTIPFYESVEGEPLLLFVARAKIELNNATTEELQRYQQIGIEASVRAYIERDDEIITASANIYSLDIVQGYDPDTGILEGVVYGELVEGHEPMFEEEFSRPLLPNTAILNIYSNYEKAFFANKNPGVYPVNVVIMYQPDSAFVSKTDMCDVVDCIDYLDEDDTFHHDVKDDHVPKPSRSVPVMCVGEWANNVIIDGVNNVFPIEYIGKPWGLGVDPSRVVDSRIRDSGFSFFFYDLRIMGGAAPWWNVIDRGRYQYLFGETVDLYAGLPTSRPVFIDGYYSLIDKANLSKGYFVPSYDYEYRGWMGEIIDQKVLAYNFIYPNEDIGEHIDNYKSFTDDDAGFLFMQEGPIWTTSCQRDLLPVLSDQEMYAPQEVSSNANAEEDTHDMSSLLPGMSYPPSLPVVDGKIYSLGEYGDTYPENNLRFTVRAVETVPGKPENPAVYVPGEDKFYSADEKVSRNNTLFFRNNNAFVIPPDTTYIRIKIGVDHVGNGVGEDWFCRIAYDDFRLIYPGYLPIIGSPEITFNNVENNSVCQGEDFSFWISYMFPSLDFELENMMISIHSIEQRPWNFWRLLKE